MRGVEQHAVFWIFGGGARAEAKARCARRHDHAHAVLEERDEGLLEPNAELANTILHAHFAARADDEIFSRQRALVCHHT